jgi:hypothetical protein
VLLFVASTLFFGVRCVPSHYNIYAFLPIYQTLTFTGFLACDSQAALTERGGSATRGNWARPHKRIARIAFLAMIVMAAWLACRNTAMQLLPFPYYLTSGCDYRSMKDVFAQVLAENPGTYYYTGGLQMLDDSLAGSVLQIDDHGRCTSPRARQEGQDKQRSIVFIQERKTYQAPESLPLQLSKVVVDATDKGPPPLPIRGLRILRVREGYGFTAYEQEPDGSINAARP